MHGDQLLLPAQGADKAKGVRAEPEHRDERERGEADQHAHEQAQTLTRTGGREHEERQHETGGCLHPDRRDERTARGLVMRRGGSRVA